MQRLTSIVAMNHEGVIGCGNALPWRLQQDMRFFRQQTIDNIVLMGRKTYDSLGGKCLTRRYNVVISHTFGLFAENETCIAAQGIEHALLRASKAPKSFKETFIIGGASMYRQFAPFVDRYLITLVNKNIAGADTFFPIDLVENDSDWEMQCLGTATDSIVNESSFAVFELLSKHPEQVARQRQEAIERAAAPIMRHLPKRPHRRTGNLAPAFGSLSWG